MGLSASTNGKPRSLPKEKTVRMSIACMWQTSPATLSHNNRSMTDCVGATSTDGAVQPRLEHVRRLVRSDARLRGRDASMRHRGVGILLPRLFAPLLRRHGGPAEPERPRLVSAPSHHLGRRRRGSPEPGAAPSTAQHHSPYCFLYFSSGSSAQPIVLIWVRGAIIFLLPQK